MLIATDKSNNLVFRFEESNFSEENINQTRSEMLKEIESNTSNCVTFDLFAVRNINNKFLQVSYDAIKATKFHSLKIINSTQEIKDILKIAKLDSIITIIS